MTRKVFELLDVPKFAYPSLLKMDAVQTAHNVKDRLESESFMSYAQPVGLIPKIVGGEFSAEQIAKLAPYKDEWKNTNLQEVARALCDEFAAKGAWYRVPSRASQVFDGLWFKPSVKGIWFDGTRPYMVGVNPRKHQTLVREHIAFLGRGMYELHGVDDPNDPQALIVDLSTDGTSTSRVPRRTIVSESEMLSVDDFEEVMRIFMEALRLAGVESIPRRLDDIKDLFRKGRGSS